MCCESQVNMRNLIVVQSVNGIYTAQSTSVYEAVTVAKCNMVRATCDTEFVPLGLMVLCSRPINMVEDIYMCRIVLNHYIIRLHTVQLHKANM